MEEPDVSLLSHRFGEAGVIDLICIVERNPYVSW